MRRLFKRRQRGAGALFVDEQGVTTTSMVLSLLITLSLLFTAMQVYRIESASADVQDVADAAALAAENQVAEYMLVARFCDAIVLSLSLTGIAVTGLGIAALCTPPTATLSPKLIDAGKKVIEVRNKFSKGAVKALNALQQALPYFAAAASAAVAAANNGTTTGASYLGMAILVPTKGEKIGEPQAEKAEELADETDERQDEIRDKAKEAEKTAQEANEHKERAFEHDCGATPSYCMYERAGKLAGLGGGSNPLYRTVDTWSFGVALDRAKAYYHARAAIEAPENDSVDEQARSALRKQFYEYASDHVGAGWVHETTNEFAAYFPTLPKNTDEMRATSLYTEQAYPISEYVERTTRTVEVPSDDAATAADSTPSGSPSGADAGAAPASAEPATMEITEETAHRYMHAYSGCPGATGAHVGYGSIAQMESGAYEKCPYCAFCAASMGKVASASSSISNGFEYHYRIVAEEAQDYERAFKEAQKARKEAQGDVSELIKMLKQALKETVSARIEATPPGRLGAVALVANVGSANPAGALGGVFVQFGGSIGPRASISAATLVDEGSDDGRTAINSVLDNLREDGGVLVGAAGYVLDAWSWMLSAYGDGQEAILGAVKGGLDALPLGGVSGLGAWVSDKLRDAIAAVGLQPAEIAALKPVVVNSAHVLAKGETAFSSGLLQVKQRVVAHPHAATDLFSAAMTDAERAALAQVDGLGDEIEIASIELLGSGGPSIPITIPLPDAVKSQSVSMIQSIFEQLRSLHAETMEVRSWE